MSQTQSTMHVDARLDPRLSAHVVRSRPLVYTTGADPSLDRPAHVRAGSGLAWLGDRLAVVQDDANFLALVDPDVGDATPIALPAGAGGLRQFDDQRGNKADKLDLETLVAVPGGDRPLLLAIGSGSTSRRESIALIEGHAAEAVAVRAVPTFYALLRAATRFAGSEMNVEGAVVIGDRLRLFNRGNGAARGDLRPVDASADVDLRALLAHLADPTAPAPGPTDIVSYALGTVDGVVLTFTDTARVPAHATVGDRRLALYTAAAEASPDVTRDGVVVGCAVGVIEERPDGIVARWAMLRRDDVPFAAKVEGIAPHPHDPRRAYVVIDRDAHDVPSELCELVLDGPWFAET
jgi:hypothetical protein